MTTEKRVALPGFCSNFTIFGYLYCPPLRQGRFPLSILLLEIHCARPFIFLWVRAWHSGCAWSVADFFALVLLLLTCSTVYSFSADTRSLADYISKLEKCYFRYGYSFAIMHQEFIDKIQNDLCNYEKLLVLFVWKLTSSRTSGHIKHNFCTINFHSSCFFSCFSASSNEK